jgi:hypothetical protein
MLKEPQACYGPVSGPENEALTLDNGFFWTRMALESGA